MPLSKQALVVLNNVNFPNNNNQYISPALLREFNGEMITALQLTQSMSEYAVINGGNSFIGNQTITGDLTVTGILTVPVIHTLYESASIIYSSGSNQLGDELTDTQTLSGSVKVQGSLTINGVPVTAGQTTGSSLITASVSLNTITFTKGDGNQFNIVVNTGSANYTDLTSLNAYTASNDIKWNTLGALTGSYATTGSNTFTGNQIIDKTKALYTNALYWTSSEVGYKNLEIINQAGGNLDFASLNGGKMRIVSTPLILTGSALSSSNDISTSANIYGANLTGSTINTGSLATTGSNTFTGVNTFNERTNLQGINVYTGSASGIYIGDRTTFAPTTAGNVPGNQHTVVGQGALGQFGNGDLNAAFGPNTLANLVSGSSNLAMGGFAGLALVNGNTNTFIGDQAGNGMKGGDNNFFLGSSAGNNFRTGSYNVMIGLNTQGNLATGSGNLFIGNQGGEPKITNNVDNQFAVAYGTDLTPRRLFFKSGSQGDNLGLYGGLEIENTLTASLANGFTYVGNASGRTTLVATSSFGGGTTYINPTLNPYSGSLILVANTFTSSSFAHISASANGQVNLVFKNNNNTGDTILSGSNNLFVNPAAGTVGFKRYMGGSGNIVLNTSSFPQISSSMAFSPTMNNNYLGGNATDTRMRGPVSSSAWSISHNISVGTINIGSSAANHAEKLVSGLTMTGNSIGGTLTIVANQSALSSSVTFTNNIVAGNATLNLSSSAAAMASNIINDNSFIFTNQFYSSSLGVGSVAMNRNNIGGSTNSIIISGSLPVGGAQSNSISDNFIFGGNNTIYIDVQNARLSGSAVYKNVIRTGLMGNNLIVSGSSLLADLSSAGSVFVGRYNVNDNIRNKTSDVVFAVGTGNTTTRKTGFLIDSGSNSYFEGTLNVSGSTTMTGSLKIASTFQLQLPTGSNQQAGTAVLDGANPGTVTVSNSLVTANSIIMLTKQTLAHPNGYVAVSAKSAGSFTITSNHNGDSDTVGYFIINNS